MSADEAIIAELRRVGGNGICRGKLAESLVAQGHDIASVYSALSALLVIRPRIVSERYHGPKKGRLLYLADAKPLSRQELIQRYLEARFSAPRGHCGACKESLPKGRSRWCSDECSRLYLGLINPTIGRIEAYRKTQACALCAAPLFVRVAPGTLGYEGDITYRVTSASGHVVERTEEKPRGFSLKPSATASWWAEWAQDRTPEMRDAELDHIVPLVEGGDHDWHNLRLLCRQCHVDETAKLTQRRAQAKRRGAGGASLPGGEVSP